MHQCDIIIIIIIQFICIAPESIVLLSGTLNALFIAMKAILQRQLFYILHVFINPLFSLVGARRGSNVFEQMRILLFHMSKNIMLLLLEENAVFYCTTNLD